MPTYPPLPEDETPPRRRPGAVPPVVNAYTGTPPTPTPATGPRDLPPAIIPDTGPRVLPPAIIPPAPTQQDIWDAENADYVKRREEQAAAAKAADAAGTVAGNNASAANRHSADPAANTQANAAATADKAEGEYDAGKDRRTVPPVVTPTTAAPVTVGTVPPVTAPDITTVGPTSAPTITTTTVNTPSSVRGLGSRIAGGEGDAATRGPAHGVTAPTIDTTKSDSARGLQGEAAREMLARLRGERPSVAEMQLKAGLDRASAEQLSIAAGARGLSVAAARRTAASETARLQQEGNAKAAELRAGEQERAAQALAATAGQMRGQDITLETTDAANKLDAGKFTAGANNDRDAFNAKARETAIQGARDRYAKGEITSTQLEVEISKAEAEYAQRTKEANARNTLEAALRSDDRLQNVLAKAAELKLKADEGNRDATVELTKLAATLESEIKRFNAAQIQGASLANVESYLKALAIDDAYIAQLRAAWLQAEQQGNAVATEALRAKVQKEVAAAMKSKDWWDKLGAAGGALGAVGTLLGALAAAGLLGGGKKDESGGGAAGNASTPTPGTPSPSGSGGAGGSLSPGSQPPVPGDPYPYL